MGTLQGRERNIPLEKGPLERLPGLCMLLLFLIKGCPETGKLLFTLPDLRNSQCSLLLESPAGCFKVCKVPVLLSACGTDGGKLLFKGTDLFLCLTEHTFLGSQGMIEVCYCAALVLMG